MLGFVYLMHDRNPWLQEPENASRRMLTFAKLNAKNKMQTSSGVYLEITISSRNARTSWTTGHIVACMQGLKNENQQAVTYQSSKAGPPTDGRATSMTSAKLGQIALLCTVCGTRAV